MSFHNQATQAPVVPQSTRLPSMMVDRRIPSISIPPPGPYSRPVPAASNGRVLPPLTLPPISHLGPPPAAPASPVNHPSTAQPHRYLIPSLAIPQTGPNMRANPAHGLASFRGGAAGNARNASSSAPAVPAVTTIVTVGRNALIREADRVMGRVEFDQLWIKKHIIDLEVYSRNDSGEEKGKVYLAIWLEIRHVELRDKQGVCLYLAKKLIPYPWFRGDASIHEALTALNRLEYVNAGLLAKKHSENAKWFWEKKIGSVSVRQFWIQEGQKMRQKSQAQARAQVQMHAQAQAQPQAQAQARAEAQADAQAQG